MKFLLPAIWTFWSIDVLALLIGLIANERRADQFRMLTRVVLLGILALFLAAAGIVSWATRSRSPGWLAPMAYCLGLPALALLYSLGAETAKPWLRKWKNAKEGSFRSPVLKQLADAIQKGDTETLTQVLAGKPNLRGKDRAGHDILTFAATCIHHDRPNKVNAVRLLLQAGCDPNAAWVPFCNRRLLTFMIIEHEPSSQEIAQLLLRYGANPNAPGDGDVPILYGSYSVETLRELLKHGADRNARRDYDGNTVLIQCMIDRNWDAAVYLVDHGADLDAPNPQGSTFDYYLNSWAPSVFPNPPKGLEELRAAVARRRLTPAP